MRFHWSFELGWLYWGFGGATNVGCVGMVEPGSSSSLAANGGIGCAGMQLVLVFVEVVAVTVKHAVHYLPQ